MTLRKKRVYNRPTFVYVCEPNEMKIIVEISSTHGSSINVKLFVNNKAALTGHYTVDDLGIDTINDRVRTFCKGLSLFTEKDIKSYVEADKFVPALYAWRNLKTVRNKLGRSIWSR